MLNLKKTVYLGKAMKKLKSVIILTVFLHLLFYAGYVVTAGIHPDCSKKEMTAETERSSCCQTEEPVQNYAEENCCESTVPVTGQDADNCCDQLNFFSSAEQTLSKCDCIHLFDTDYSFLQTTLSQDNSVQQYPAGLKYNSDDNLLVNNNLKFNDFRLTSDYHPDLCICNCTLLI